MSESVRLENLASETKAFDGSYNMLLHVSFLPMNHHIMCLILGFNVIKCDVNDEKFCYCPCSKRCTKWKKNFHLSSLAKYGDECAKYKGLTYTK